MVLNVQPVAFALDEVEFLAIRAQGAGGQNVNKVSNAIHLRFDVAASSLADEIKQRILAWSDQRISREGVIVIKAQRFRSLEKKIARMRFSAFTSYLPKLIMCCPIEPPRGQREVRVGNGLIARFSAVR